jgi:hypothetical protein
MKLAIRETVRKTVEAALKQFPNNPRSPFLAALLKDQEPANGCVRGSIKRFGGC